MKKIKFILFILASLFIFACGGDSTSVEFETVAYISTRDGYVQKDDVTEIPADGKSYLKITALLKSAEGEVVDGRKVEFKTDNGFLEEISGDKEVTIKTSASKAVVKLYAPSIEGSANVEALFDDSNFDGTKVTETLSVKFGNLATGEKLSACHFELTCPVKNLGGLIDANIATECFIKTENRREETVQVPNIEFKTEVGKVLTVDGDIPSSNRYFYIADPNKKPQDVDPIYHGEFSNCDDCSNTENVIERCRCDLSKTLNPRDNLVTIMAYANGEECFNDLNSNGEFDMKETVYGNFLGEPYVDSNDNAKRDSKEQYVESNSADGNPNGYDEENGAWDDDINIWTQTKILLTGEPYESDNINTRFESQAGAYIDWSAPETIPALKCGEQLKFKFFLYDKYLNPIATNKNSSTMTIKISGDDISDEYNKTNSELNFKVNKFGFELDEKGRIEYFNHKDKDYGSEYDIIVKSTATEDTCSDYKEDKTYTVEVTINTTPGTQNDYYPVQDEKISKINKVWKFSGKITK